VSVGKGSLNRVLRETCISEGAVAYGIASAADVDDLPRVKIRWGIDRYSKKPKSIMPSARSIIVFGVASSDDAHELAVHTRGEDYEYPGYLPLIHIRKRAASVLRENGYDCIFPSERNALMSFKRVVQLAGIGGFGKNSLVISPEHGPWLRFSMLLTDAPLKPSKPFTRDLCRACSICISACPVGALKPYVVDDRKCLVSMNHQARKKGVKPSLLKTYEPQLTRRSHVMCTACQIVCPYTSDERRARSHVFSIRQRGDD